MFLFIASYFLIINLIGYSMMGWDKRKAKRHLYRIPEATLWQIAWVGGAIGATVGMLQFHHKTRHDRFRYGFPLLALLDLLLLLTLAKIFPY